MQNDLGKTKITGPNKKLKTTRLIVLTASEVESDATDHVVVAEAIVVPDRDLEGAIGQLGHGDALPGDGLLPPGVGRPSADGRLLLPVLVALRKEVAGRRSLR